MKKIDRTVLTETGYIALSVLILSALMQAVFLAVGAWDGAVLLGNLLGGAVAITNFFLMGLTVQAATAKDEKSAKAAMRSSQSLRTVFLFAAAALGVLLPCFDTIASLLPLFFPRIAIFFRPLVGRKKVENKVQPDIERKE